MMNRLLVLAACLLFAGCPPIVINVPPTPAPTDSPAPEPTIPPSLVPSPVPTPLPSPVVTPPPATPVPPVILPPGVTPTFEQAPPICRVPQPVGPCRLKQPPSQLYRAIGDAVAQLKVQQPEIFSGSRVLDAIAYFNGMIANLYVAGYCAEMDSNELAISQRGASYRENFQILSSVGMVRYGPLSFESSCVNTTAPPEVTPVPTPTTAPCVSDCVKPAGCVSCAEFRDDALRRGHLSKDAAGRLYNDPDNDPSKREYMDPNTCFMVRADGSLRNKRHHNSGAVCPDCKDTCAPTPAPAVTPVPTPQPGATPDSCPPLARVGSSIHACQRGGQTSSCGDLRAGDKLIGDTTHHFGRPVVASCDDLTDTACGGRLCSGFAGSRFVFERGANCSVSGSNPFQFVCSPLVSGSYRVKSCAPADYRDRLGQPVATPPGDDSCSTLTWNVR